MNRGYSVSPPNYLVPGVFSEYPPRPTRSPPPAAPSAPHATRSAIGHDLRKRFDD